MERFWGQVQCSASVGVATVAGGVNQPGDDGGRRASGDVRHDQAVLVQEGGYLSDDPGRELAGALPGSEYAA